jgi:hypothetical protein
VPRDGEGLACAVDGVLVADKHDAAGVHPENRGFVVGGMAGAELGRDVADLLLGVRA